MTQPRPILPRLAYLTSPGPGVILLNLQFADGELPLGPGETWPSGSFIRLELTQRQLASILVDGTAMALNHQGPVARCERVDEALAGQLRRSMEINGSLRKEIEELKQERRHPLSAEAGG